MSHGRHARKANRRAAQHARPKQVPQALRSTAVLSAAAGAAMIALNVTGSTVSAATIPHDTTSQSFDRPHPQITVAAKAIPEHYRVRSGDTLSSIAKRKLGKAAQWPKLWWANRKDIRNPNVIRTGMTLSLPGDGRMSRRITLSAYAAIPPPPSPPKITPSETTPSATQSSAPVASAPVQATASYSGGSGFQQCVIAAESGGNPGAVNPSSGAGGLYGFLPSTWQSLGHSGLPEDASVAEQNAAFAQEYAAGGTSAWAPYDGC